MQLDSKGFYEEPIGTAKIINYFHKIYFSYNLTQLSIGYENVYSSTYKMINTFNGNEHYYHQSQLILSSLDKLRDSLYKLINRREKKGTNKWARLSNKIYHRKLRSK